MKILSNQQRRFRSPEPWFRNAEGAYCPVDEGFLLILMVCKIESDLGISSFPLWIFATNVQSDSSGGWPSQGH
jgi:hypothetical protein